MPKTIDQKKEIVQNLAEKFARSKSVVFGGISGFTMSDADGLRALSSEAEVDVLVVKKTLLARAAKEANLEADLDSLAGSVLTFIGYGDEIAPAKMAANFAKKRDSLKILAGLVGREFMSGEQILRLAKLPGRKELLSGLVGTIQAPVSGFVRVLAANLTGLVRVLDAIKTSK